MRCTDLASCAMHWTVMLRAVSNRREQLWLVKPRAQDRLAACKTLATGPGARGVYETRRGINISETSLDILTLKDGRECVKQVPGSFRVLNFGINLQYEHFIRCREILAGVREHGSYKRYLRAPHRQFVRLCSLLVRRREERTNRLLLERLRTEESPWSSLGSIPVWKSAELHLLQRIARLPNGPCWNVLSYWREAE